MNNKENQIYYDKIEEIGDKVYRFYKLSSRDDLVMFYSMKEDRLYSYIYKEFYDSLNKKSKMILRKQFKEAKAENKIVLFINDEIRCKLKSFTI